MPLVYVKRGLATAALAVGNRVTYGRAFLMLHPATAILLGLSSWWPTIVRQ
jgi:hypothetical protein